MQEAVVAHSSQPGRQDVLQHTPKKVGYGQLAKAKLFGFGIDISEANDSGFCIKAGEIALANDAAIKLARQVLQRRLAVADVAAVDDPFFGHADGK